MTVLPIVDRELRVAARRSVTFWVRVLAAAAALFVGGAVLLFTVGAPRGIPIQPGVVLFSVLKWMCFVFAGFAGVFFTSDCLSEERREGTLGLLFLTDLRGYDVVLGKLLSASLRCVYGLLAVFPVIAIAFLTGGLQAGEFWRTVAALLNTLFFSLTLGVFISSVSFDAQRALSCTLLFGLFLFCGLPALDPILEYFDAPPNWQVCHLGSPATAFLEAGASRSGVFWTSLLVSHALGWLFLGGACGFAPRIWQDRPRAEANWQSRRRRRIQSSPRHTAWRQRLLEANPLRWLAARASDGTVFLSVAALAGLLTVLAIAWVKNSVWHPAAMMIYFLFLVLLVVWLASQACRPLAEARQNGLLELVLAAPVTVSQIINGQWYALRRKFAGPALLTFALMVWVQLGQLLDMMKHSGGTTNPGMHETIAVQVLTLILGMISFFINLLALGWMGLWMGLNSKNANVAIVKTLLFTELLPWFALTFLQGVLSFFLFFPLISTGAGPALQRWLPWISTVVVAHLGIAVHLWLVWLAHRRVMTRFRDYAARGASPVSGRGFARKRPAAPLPVPSP